MKVLLVNKFLYRAGGAENYMFNVGNLLKKNGHEVQYFGLKDEKNIVESNNSYVTNYENKKVLNPLTLIYNLEAKRKIKKVIKEYKPDIVHFNNISYHLTSSIIDMCYKMKVPMVMTNHDPQLVCPNHMLYRFDNKKICNECIERKDFKSCIKYKCLKGSLVKSYIAYFESIFAHKYKKYEKITKFICPSNFMKEKLLAGGIEKEKIILLRNFSNLINNENVVEKKDYILYFGRLSEEKGIDILINALPKNINLIIAGSGPLEEKIKSIKENNIKYVGFKSGEELRKLIKEALFTVYPSKWYENAPLSIFESITLGTPVIATNEGGIKELVDENVNGLFFENENVEDLKNKIELLYSNKELRENMYMKCYEYKKVPNEEMYIQELLKIYEECIENEKNIK